MSEAPEPKRLCLSKTELNEMTKDDIIGRWIEQECYLDLLETKANDRIKDNSELVGLRESEEKLKQQQAEATRRENVLVMRLTTKEQEMQEYANQIQELKQAQVPGTSQLRSSLLDPAVNLMFERMKKGLDSTKAKLEETQNDLSAWKFTPDSNTGKRLMAKCRLLHQENEELGKMISSGRIAKLEGDLALQRNFSEEMKKSQADLDEFLMELDEDVEGMQSTIYYLQQQLRESKDVVAKLQQENQRLRVTVTETEDEEEAKVNDAPIDSPIPPSEQNAVPIREPVSPVLPTHDYITAENERICVDEDVTMSPVKESDQRDMKSKVPFDSDDNLTDATVLSVADDPVENSRSSPALEPPADVVDREMDSSPVLEIDMDASSVECETDVEQRTLPESVSPQFRPDEDDEMTKEENEVDSMTEMNDRSQTNSSEAREQLDAEDEDVEMGDDELVIDCPQAEVNENGHSSDNEEEMAESEHSVIESRLASSTEDNSRQTLTPSPRTPESPPPRDSYTPPLPSKDVKVCEGDETTGLVVHSDEETNCAGVVISRDPAEETSEFVISATKKPALNGISDATSTAAASELDRSVL